MRGNGNSAEDLSRERQEVTVAIRKNKRLQNLQKRRALAKANAQQAGQQVNAAAANPANESKGSVATVEQLPTIAAQLKSMTPSQRYEATRSVRRLLSRQEQPPAEAVIQAGLVPILVAELGLVSEEKTQFEAAWALTNIASTEHTRVVVKDGAVPYLVKLMMSKNPDIREQCLWCLGNIAGDGPDMRDLVLKVPQSLNNLLMNIKHAATTSLLGNAVWTLSNFCRGKPQPPIEAIKPALPYLAKLITHNKMDIVGDASWAISYISDGDDDRIQACVDLNIVPTLIRLISAEKVSVVTPALRSLGNIVSGNDKQTQAVIDANIFSAIAPLLNHGKRNVRKEASWTLSNIAAGTPPQVDQLVAQKEIILRVLELLDVDDFEVRKEAAWVISNICTGGSTANIDAIVGMGALNTICSILDISDVKICLVALDALDAILRKTGSLDYANVVEECGGVDKLEDLQDHSNEEVYRKAVAIVEEYYNPDEEDEEEADSNLNGAENQDPTSVAGKSDFGGAFSANMAAADPFGTGGNVAMDWGF